MDGRASDKARKLQTLQAILGHDVSQKRLQQILGASNGSVEHAIEIFFHQHEQPQCQHQSSTASTNDLSLPQATSTFANCKSNHVDQNHDSTIERTKRSPQSMSTPGKRLQSPSKQARLDSYFSVCSNYSISKPVSVTEIPERKSQNGSESRQHKPDLEMTGTDYTNTKPSPCYSNVLKQKLSSAFSSGVPGVVTSAERVGFQSNVAIFTFQRFVELLQQLADTTKRTVKLNALESFIHEIKDTEGVDLSTQAHTLTSAIELVLGGRTSQPLHVSGSAVSYALQISLGVSRNQLSKVYRQYGDLGDCAASFFQKKSFFVTSDVRQHSIVQVAEGLKKISTTDGRDAKQHVVLSLLRGCQSKTEIRFLVRLLLSNMRVGANLKTVLAALAMAVVSRSNDALEENGVNDELRVKRAIALVQKTHDICPNIEKIVMALLQGGLEQMKRDCFLQLHIPIAPMLAHPIHSLDEVQKVMRTNPDGAVMEFKYDGMRLQAHYDGSSIKLFSRHMLETTNQFPEVSSYLLQAFQTDGNSSSTEVSFIIDAEVVGVEDEGENTRLLPFQDLSTRRKKNVNGNGIRVKIFAFDLMVLDGVLLVNEPLSRRRNQLMQRFRATRDFTLVESQPMPQYDEDRMIDFLTQAVECGAEGIMVKMLDNGTTYEAGTRSKNWLKVKRDYIGRFADTIDVVPIGAWYGNGRKAQKSFLSPVLLAVYDDQEDVFRSICRCMSFTDTMYESMREFYFRGVQYGEEGVKSSCLQGITKERESSDIESDDDTPLIADDEPGSNDSVKDGAGHNNEDRVNCFPGRPSSAFVVTNESPPIWFKPLEVFEVSFADLSLSRQHTAAAGLVDVEGRGIALRFPRFKRRRPDKKPEQATTSTQVAQLFAKQSKTKSVSKSR
jgi:ATP-dependent DNA ligase I